MNSVGFPLDYLNVGRTRYLGGCLFKKILKKPIFNLVRVLYLSFVYDVRNTSVDNKFTLMRVED